MRLKDLREDRDLRQIDVATATGIDQRSLSNYETGKTSPDAVTILKLADFFGVTCDYLLGRTALNLQNSEDVAREVENIKEKLENCIKELEEIQRALPTASKWKR